MLFQAQKGSILHSLAKVLNFFEVSSISDVMGLDLGFFLVVLMLFTLIKNINQPDVLLLLKWPRSFCSHEFNLLVV